MVYEPFSWIGAYAAGPPAVGLYVTVPRGTAWPSIVTVPDTLESYTPPQPPNTSGNRTTAPIFPRKRSVMALASPHFWQPRAGHCSAQPPAPLLPVGRVLALPPSAQRLVLAPPPLADPRPPRRHLPSLALPERPVQ